MSSFGFTILRERGAVPGLKTAKLTCRPCMPAVQQQTTTSAVRRQYILSRHEAIIVRQASITSLPLPSPGPIYLIVLPLHIPLHTQSISNGDAKAIIEPGWPYFTGLIIACENGKKPRPHSPLFVKLAYEAVEMINGPLLSSFQSQKEAASLSFRLFRPKKGKLRGL